MRTVTLVRAEPRLLTVVAADEILWLLPGVRFTDADGSSWEVLTVADDYVAYVTPEEMDAPEPASRPCAPTRGEVDPPGRRGHRSKALTENDANTTRQSGCRAGAGPRPRRGPHGRASW